MPLLLVEEVLKEIKSWPAYYRELKRLHATDTVTDSDEYGDVTVYLKTHNPSWRDIARVAYCCGEEAVMERVFKCEILLCIGHFRQELYRLFTCTGFMTICIWFRIMPSIHAKQLTALVVVKILTAMVVLYGYNRSPLYSHKKCPEHANRE